MALSLQKTRRSKLAGLAEMLSRSRIIAHTRAARSPENVAQVAIGAAQVQTRRTPNAREIAQTPRRQFPTAQAERSVTLRALQLVIPCTRSASMNQGHNSESRSELCLLELPSRSTQFSARVLSASFMATKPSFVPRSRLALANPTNNPLNCSPCVKRTRPGPLAAILK